MCRIVGFRDFAPRGRYSQDLAIRAMTESLVHGGPDGVGHFSDLDRGVALGHRRLAILDLTPTGRQPMESADGRHVIVYNGEVYNFADLRLELSGHGHRFRGTSDTEVLLAAWQEWGVDGLTRLRGMFAFAIWDRREHQLWLARDRLGVKPLYYYWDGSLFLFASEIRAFRHHPGFQPQVCRDAVAQYLRDGFVAAPGAVFRHSHKLMPGSFVSIDDQGTLNSGVYWTPEGAVIAPGEVGVSNQSDAYALEHLQHLLEEAVRLRMVADVPVGCFLSGGTDSSLVAALMQRQARAPVRTFTVAFEDHTLDESAAAFSIARQLGTDHAAIVCSAAQALDVVPRLGHVFDEPFADSSAIPTFLVSEFARREVKVVLSGDGGDELFQGYDSFEQLRAIRSGQVGPVPRAANLLAGLLGVSAQASWESAAPGWMPVRRAKKLLYLLGTRDLQSQWEGLGATFTPAEIAKLMGGEPFEPRRFGLPALEDDRRIMLLYLKGWLPDDALCKVDRASMAHGLEVREPLLDASLVQWAIGIPRHLKVRGGVRKWALKQVLQKYLPRHLIGQRKQGFGVPLDDWLRGGLRALVGDLLLGDADHVLLDSAAVRATVGSFFGRRGVSASQVWNILMLSLWRDSWRSR